MKQKGNSVLTILLVLVVLIVAGYFAYKYFAPQFKEVVPQTQESAQSAVVEDKPVIVEPKNISKLVSPQIVRGTVPPGWMFEGSFPIKLLDVNRKLIVQAAAVEEVPGAWQSNVPVYFTVTITFSTKSKTGFLELENDNPSGDPAKSQTFEVPVTF